MTDQGQVLVPLVEAVEQRQQLLRSVSRIGHGVAIEG
jgi:hypothetical protein